METQKPSLFKVIPSAQVQPCTHWCVQTLEEAIAAQLLVQGFPHSWYICPPLHSGSERRVLCKYQTFFQLIYPFQCYPQHIEKI